MKKLLLACVAFSFIANPIYAVLIIPEGDCKFPMDSTIWSQIEIYDSQTPTHVIIGTTNDTIIDGLTYYKLYLMTDTTYKSSDVLIGFIRENDFRIYLRQENCEKPTGTYNNAINYNSEIEDEILLYDFSNRGYEYTFAACRPNDDRWNPIMPDASMNYDQFGFGSAVILKHNEIDNGYQVVHLKSTSYNKNYQYRLPEIIWHERYGCSTGFFGTFYSYNYHNYSNTECPECGTIVMHRGKLGCVKHKNEILFKSDEIESCFDAPPMNDSYIVTQVEEAKSLDTTIDIIHSNDSHRLQVRSQHPIDKLQLFTIKGILVCESEGNELTLPSIDDGVYLLNIVQERKNNIHKIRFFR